MVVRFITQLAGVYHGRLRISLEEILKRLTYLLKTRSILSNRLSRNFKSYRVLVIIFFLIALSFILVIIPDYKKTPDIEGLLTETLPTLYISLIFFEFTLSVIRFTQKNELENRYLFLFPTGYYGLHISTFLLYLCDTKLLLYLVPVALTTVILKLNPINIFLITIPFIFVIININIILSIIRSIFESLQFKNRGYLLLISICLLSIFNIFSEPVNSIPLVSNLNKVVAGVYYNNFYLSLLNIGYMLLITSILSCIYYFILRLIRLKMIL